MPTLVCPHCEKLILHTAETDRFWNQVNKHGSIPPHMPHLGNCWEWVGVRDKGSEGYGIFRKGSKRFAHRVSWMMHTNNTRVPEGMCIMHLCDNPGCVRPTHLQLGSNDENTKDKVAKGRQAKGELVGTARLTDAKVVDILRMYHNGTGKSAIARTMSVDPSTVASVISGECWSHVYTAIPRTTEKRRPVYRSILSEDKVVEVHKMRATGMLLKDIGTAVGVDRKTASDILKGKTWKHVSVDFTYPDKKTVILTENDVREIRSLYATGSYTKPTLAKRFGVKTCTIKDVVSGKTWKHVI